MPRWKKTLFVASVAQLLSMMAFSFVLPFIPLYIQEELGVADKIEAAAWTGWIRFGSGISMAIFSPLWGYVADKYGRKIMLERALFGGAVILTLMGIVQTPMQLLLLRTIQGAITGTVAAGIPLVTGVAPSEKTGFSLGVMQAAGLAGLAFGTLIGGIMAEAVGYRAPFVVVGLLLWCGGTVVAVGAEEEFSRPRNPSSRHHEKLSSVLGIKGFAVMIAVIFTFQYAVSVFRPVFALFVKDLVGEEGAASTTGTILFVARILALVSAIAVSRAGARVGYKRAFIGGVALAGVMAAPQALVRNTWELFGLRAAFGFFFGLVPPMANAMVSTIVPRHSYGKAYGLTHSITSIGRAMGALTGGSIAKYAGDNLGLRLPFAVTGAVLVIAALIAAVGIKQQRPALASEEASGVINPEA